MGYDTAVEYNKVPKSYTQMTWAVKKLHFSSSMDDL